MLIFLIEDSKPKADRIVEFLQKDFHRFSVRAFESYQSGLRAIEVSVADLIVLDMTLPNFDRRPNEREGRLRPLGGYELMRKLKLRGPSSRVIIVTQLEEFGEGPQRVTFEEMVSRCSNEFPDLLLGSVYFGQVSNNG
jgi:CheY-like chemotaxis protein